MKTKFSIVVPLFNEEENIYPLVQTIISAVGNDPRFFEIILVDDGSVDKTATLAMELTKTDQRVRFVQHSSNKGLGAAIRTGLNAAEGDFVLYTDADLPFDFNLMPELFSLASENHIVSGFRLNRGEGWRRLVLTKCYNALIWFFYGLYMQDVNFACKIFPQQFLQKAEFKSRGSFIDVEILLEARRFGMNILEHPLIYYPRERGLSTLSRPGVILFILKEMFGYSAKLFAEFPIFLNFIKVSPLAKSGIFSLTAFVSVVLLLERVQLNQGIAWLIMSIGAGLISLLLGWRLGLMIALLTGSMAELSFVWKNQPFLNPQIYLLLIGSFFGVLISQVLYHGWLFVQKSSKLNTSE